MNSALESATAAGNLDDAVALRDEVKRMTDQRPLPSLDFTTLPDSLKKLRAIYREALAKLPQETAPKVQALHEIYDGALEAYQTELLKAKRLDDAVRVRAVRDTLAKNRPQGQMVAPVASNLITSLFNGRTLEGWRVDGDRSAFEVVGGLIHANGRVGNLVCTTGTWKDFELKLKAKTEGQGNSGVWIHIPKSPQDGVRSPGLEVQIYNDGPGSQKTGSLYNVRPVTSQSVKSDQWFDLRITVKDKTIEVFINNKRVNDWTQPLGWQPPSASPQARLGSGTIGLQSQGGTVWFQDIFIRPL